MSIVLLCGENKTGKTTIADLLVEKHGFKKMKFSAPKKKEDMFVTYIKALKSIKKNQDVVLDRFHFCDMVFGPIYRGFTDISKRRLVSIEKRLTQLNTMVVYCHDSIPEISMRFKQDKETFARPDQIGNILRGYEDVLKQTTLPVIRHKMNSRNDLTKGKRLETLVKKLDVSQL